MKYAILGALLALSACDQPARFSASEVADHADGMASDASQKAQAASDQVDAQNQKIADLEGRLAADETEISKMRTLEDKMADLLSADNNRIDDLTDKHNALVNRVYQPSTQ